jgi:hypothetical protein
MEDWKVIDDYPDYEVSSLGRVKSNKYPNKPKMLKSNPNSLGYCQVGLKREVLKTKKNHILVLEAFTGPRPKGMEACHNDGDKNNNRLSNLRWDTPKNNAKDKIKHGTTIKGMKNPKAKLKEYEAETIPWLFEQGFTRRELAGVFNVSHSAICHVLKGRTWNIKNEEGVLQ